MQNPMIEMLFNQLRMQNPQMYQQLNNLKNNGANPQALIQQMMAQTNPQQIQRILGQAKMLGVPDDVLAQIQNMQNR